VSDRSSVRRSPRSPAFRRCTSRRHSSFSCSFRSHFRAGHSSASSSPRIRCAA